MAKNINNELKEHNIGTFTYNVIADYGTINERTDYYGKKWSKKVRCISWNGKQPLWDIREWSDDDTGCRRGLTFNIEEIDALTDVLIAMREAWNDSNKAGVVGEA